MTGDNFLNINPNDLILFLLFVKYCLVYFVIYFKIFQTTFCTLFKVCVNSNLFKIGFVGERRKLSKVLESTSPLHTLKASILSRGIMFCGLFDTVITPP